MPILAPIECQTAREFMDTISPMNPNPPVNRSRGSGSLLYRGQADAEWHLIPKILRNGPNDAPNLAANMLQGIESPTYENQIQAELILLGMFVRACDRQGLSLPLTPGQIDRLCSHQWRVSSHPGEEWPSQLITKSQHAF